MRFARSLPLRIATIVLLGSAAGLAQVNVGSLADDGWYSDDTRADGSGTILPAGTNLKSPLLTAAPESGTGSSTHDADIMGQIMFGSAPGTVPAGTWQGSVHLFIDAVGGGSGKSQISHRKDDLTGHGPGSSFGPGFTAEYSWMGNGPSAMTASLKFGIKTSEFGSTPVSTKTGENVWDKVLIYEPGNGNTNLSDGLWHTETISYTSGKWWFFDRTVGAGTIGMPRTLALMAGDNDTTVFSGTKTISDVWDLITAPSATITSVQFGIGSGNPGANVYVNQLETSAYLGGAKVTFGGTPVICDQNVTPDVIFGSGNANGSYTVNRNDGIELGMRGKLRFPASNVFNSNGDGTYTFHTGSGTSTFPNSEWSFEWSVNTDYDGAHPARDLGDLTYEIGMDNDPGPGTDYLVFDPISIGTIIPYTVPAGPIPYWDHSVGDNSTANGGGLEASDGTTYATYLSTYNVAQNSWRPTFYQNTAPYSWDPNVPGRYDYYLAAFDGSDEVARTHITIVVVPPVTFDQNVTPDVIFGSGNVNGSYTKVAQDGVEIGMRGKLRFPASNVFNSNGDGTYTFNTGSGTSVFPKSEWSFEWSVNTDYNGANPSRKVGDLTWEIGMDNDPGAGTNYLVFDPISIGTIIPYTVPAGPIPVWDHSMGDNTTPNGGGVEAVVPTGGAVYAGYLTTYNVAQNSWQPTFYQNTAPYSWNPNTVGRYEYYLAALDGGSEIARSAITIIATSGASMLLEGSPCQKDQDCNLAGSQIVLRLYARNLDSAVTGWQAFLAFDPTKLTYVGSASSYTSTIFEAHVQPIATANVASGEIRLDGSSFDGSTTADNLLATLVFTATSECTPASVSFDLTQPFDSEFSNMGSPLATSLVDSAAITADATPPVLVQPSDVTVAAEAGVGTGCTSAVATFATPVATDNCSGAVTVACYPPSGSTFPLGTSTVTCVATDACGNTATRTFDVTVSSVNEVHLSVQLLGVTTATVRCIRFQTDGCAFTDVPLAFDGTGLFTGVIEIPCGSWTTICAKDEQHTEWDSARLTVSAGDYYAGATLELPGGDTDDDGDVDIHDVTWLIAQFGGLAASGGCAYDGTTRDADFSNNGAVGSEDYSFLVANWLTTSSCLSCPMPLTWTPGEPGFEVSVVVHDAVTAAADLDRNGLVDHRDVKLYETANGLPHELSETMRTGRKAGH